MQLISSRCNHYCAQPEGLGAPTQPLMKIRGWYLANQPLHKNFRQPRRRDEWNPTTPAPVCDVHTTPGAHVDQPFFGKSAIRCEHNAVIYIKLSRQVAPARKPVTRNEATRLEPSKNSAAKYFNDVLQAIEQNGLVLKKR